MTERFLIYDVAKDDFVLLTKERLGQLQDAEAAYGKVRMLLQDLFKATESIQADVSPYNRLPKENP